MGMELAFGEPEGRTRGALQMDRGLAFSEPDGLRRGALRTDIGVAFCGSNTRGGRALSLHFASPVDECGELC